MDWCRDWDTSHRHGAVLECRRADLEGATDCRQAGNWGSIGCLSGWVATRRDNKVVTACLGMRMVDRRRHKELDVVGIWTRNRFRSTV